MHNPAESPLNGTVFGVAPMRVTLPLAGLMLAILFIAMEPAVTAGLNVVERTVFWVLHVSVGLGGIAAASLVIRQLTFARWHPSLLILLAGVVGAFIVTPMFLVLEFLLPAHMIKSDDDALDVFAARSVGHAVIAEYLDVVPLLVTAWVAINLPLILRPGGRPPAGGGPNGGKADVDGQERETLLDPAKEQFFEKLPEALGRDIVAISSDLHYLHVFTTQGRTMIIGSLRDVALTFADEGMLVHKSHWVCHGQVIRYAPAAQRAHCIMSTGIKVPVSRRRRAQVKAMYGDASTVKLASVGS